MKHTRITSMVVFLSIVFSFQTDIWSATETVPNQDDLLKLIESMVDPELGSLPEAYGPAPGAVLQVNGPDFQFLEARGFADLQNKILIKPDTLFEIGSNTKLFTALLFMQQAEDDNLLLDDPLSKWLPEWAQKIPNGDAITLRQLATHTSGIWDYADEIIGAGIKDDSIMQRYFSPDELIQYVIDNGEADFAPGAEGRWKYSNSGYILLGMVLEKVTGKPYAELLRERIIEPLQLNHTYFPDSVPDIDGLAQGYVSYPGGKNTTRWNLSQGWAAGGIISTAADLGKFMQALANGRFFRDPSTLLAMGQFVRNDEAAMQLGAKGYGIGLIEYSNGVWGHGGQTLGFESQMMFVPGTNISVIALSNAAYGPLLQVRELVPVLQKMAGILPEHAAVFPRPEPDYKGKRSLDFKPYAAAMNSLSMDRIVALDALLLIAATDMHATAGAWAMRD